MTLRTIKIIAQAPAVAPAWALALGPDTVGKWQTIHTNTILSVYPGNKVGDSSLYTPAELTAIATNQAIGDTRVTSSSGGELAMNLGQYGKWLVMGGGDSSHVGNEVYAFDLGTATWDRLNNPFLKHPSFPTTYAQGYLVGGTAENADYRSRNGAFPDGSPGVSHNYDWLRYHPASKRLFVPKVPLQETVPKESTASFFSFSIDANAWTYHLPPVTNGEIGAEGWSVYDPDSDSILLSGGTGTGGSPRVHRYTNLAGSPARALYRSSSALARAASAAVTTLYDGISSGVIVYNPNDKNASWATGNPLGTFYRVVALSASAVPTTINQSVPMPAADLNGMGTRPSDNKIVWSANQQALIMGTFNTPNVFRFTRTAAETWAWTNVLSPSNTVTPETTSLLGLHGRFQVVSYGTTDYAIMVRTVSGPVYAMRLN